MMTLATSLNILGVDDDAISRDVLHEHLKAAGHQVRMAADVVEAKALFAREHVDIVIADWIMPGQSGLDLCEWVRHQPCGSSVHFVMLTVLSDKAKLIEAFRSGVDDFLSKPLHDGELFARLRAWTRIVSLKKQLAQRHADALRALAELSAANAKLAELATRDELTGLHNRREAVRRLHEQWSVATRYEQPLCCAVVDVDHFKKVNDTYGHHAGDELLRRLAESLQGCLREADSIFRIGGDEFLVILPCIRFADAATWARRCAQTIAASPVTIGGAPRHPSVSIGIAERTPTMHDWRELVEAADQAVFASKRQGRIGTRSDREQGLLFPADGEPMHAVFEPLPTNCTG
jgi:diguanylate cyclase (GGDEF)-like protein